MCYLESNDFLADKQNGYRKDRSSKDHLPTINSLIHNSSNIYITLID